MDTSNFVEIAWIVMGLWASIKVLNEVTNVIQWYSNENIYWKKRNDALIEENNRLRLTIAELRKEDCVLQSRN